MLRDVFYYGAKPNVHPREQFAENLADARKKSTTEHFWIVNEYCDYRSFDWDFDFETLPDSDVWAQDHNNIWPSQHQKDSGTWLCPKEYSDLNIYRGDVGIVKRIGVMTECWNELDNIDHLKFDFTWHPDPTDPPYIYKWGCKFFPPEIQSVLEFYTPGATRVKYMKTIAELLPSDSWIEYQSVDKHKFDMSWRPNPLDPPFIYVWGNKYVAGTDKPTLEYVVEGATRRKYMPELLEVLPEWEHWTLLRDVDTSSFDFAWRPDPKEPPFIYVWGNQYYDSVKMPTVEYKCPKATQRKYMDDRVANLKSSISLYQHLENSYLDDYSWIPDPDSPAYIYAFGNQWNKPEDKASVLFVVDGATKYKYMEQRATRRPCLDNWIIPEHLDVSKFDFSWEPSPAAPPYIYEFGTQWQPNGGPQYVVPSASEFKYVDTQKAIHLPYKDNWEILENVDETVFDFSWHPDNTAPPLIYVWGNQWNKSVDKASVQYVVPGATEYQYMDGHTVRTPDMSNWVIPEDVDCTGFDFSWEPSPAAPPYIYEFATQWQKTGGPQYVVPGATEKQYVDFQKVKKLPSNKGWTIPDNIDSSGFDFSWHPDDTSPPYVYIFATQWAFSGGPVYTVDSASEIKYVDDQIATAKVDRTNWVYDENEIDINSFDFSWHPYVEDQPYIYQFGTQWQKTGGPRYITPGADSSSPVKYIDTRILKATRIPNKNDTHWNLLYPIENFDFSWHPDDTEEPYIYIFGNQWHSAEVMPTVEYVIEGAKAIKYVHVVVATLSADATNWIIPDNVDTNSFDFSWRPEPGSPPYIYEFSTQWQKTGGPQYVMEGATEKNYVSFQKASNLPSTENWIIPDNIDVSTFDFSWHPDATDPSYIYQFGTQWALSGGPRYAVEGATEIKYMDELTAIALPDRTNWVYDENEIDINSFDFSWHPYVEDQPYIYQFGTQWQKTGGPKYITPGADSSSPIKYIDTRILRATRLPNKDHNYHVINGYPILEFDYSWHPDDTEEPYTYVFGNKYYTSAAMPTIEYRVPGATQFKYINDVVATLAPDTSVWIIPDNLDVSSFDFGWRPSPLEEPYIYQFGTQWQKTGGPTYTIEGATQVKYVDGVKATHLVDMTNWIVPDDIAIDEFDFTWHPDETADPIIYQFGTQWQKTGGPKYITPGCNSKSDIQYVNVNKSRKLPNKSRFTVLGGAKVRDFDWSWHPDDTSPPYIYQFGNQWYPADEMPTIECKVPGATEAKFINDITAKLAPNLDNWYIPDGIDVNKFDFSWIPHPSAKPYTYQFGTSSNPKDGPIYNAIGTDGETINVPRVEIDEMEVLNEPNSDSSNHLNLTEINESDTNPKLDIFFVDKGNIESANRFQALKDIFGAKIQKTRYLNSWVDTILRCTNRATSDLFWVLNSELDYSQFDFDYYPNLWQMKMVHVFGTQHSHWGTTFMINRESFPEDTKHVKVIEHLSNLNFVKHIKAIATECVHDIVIIDHGNNESLSVIETFNRVWTPNRNVTVVPYENSYLNTLKNIIRKQQEKKEHYLWICSTVCDYKDFDFTYICDPFSKDQLHVFPSDSQKFGDTFFIDVNKAREVINETEKLETYNKVNYNGAVHAKRLPSPIIVTNEDTHTESALNVSGFPYARLVTEDNLSIDVPESEPMNLWSPETKNIMITATGATHIVVPSEVKDYVKKELYEYPYIKRAPKLSISNPLDIVYLSNGETGAEENWEHLLTVTKGLKNRVIRVDGVNGRAAAYHAAAEASNTPWMFTVFAKLKVSPKFDWNWQPDRMQSPKHYIFHAKNPVNGLTYGHQAMIAYNKKLTLANTGQGLDFTLDDEHEVVPLISGTANYNTDEFSTWRTAFREVIKLKADNSDISRERLDVWLNKAQGEFAQYSIKGALDADEYYDEVNGDFVKLKLSYEWSWLRDRFEKL